MIGRIYRLSGGDKFYIGSTTQTLRLRLKNHRSKSKEDRRKNTPIYKHFNEIGWDKATIEIMCELEFADKHAMFEYERQEIEKYINDVNCLNCIKPIIALEEKKQRDKEYGKKRRTEQKEKERQRVAVWRANNPEKYAAQVRRSVEKQRAKKNLE